MVERIELVELTKWLDGLDGYICFKWQEICFYSFVGLVG